MSVTVVHLHALPVATTALEVLLVDLHPLTAMVMSTAGWFLTTFEFQHV
jgi:hypothetical protein